MKRKPSQGSFLHLEPGDFVTVIGGNGAGSPRCSTPLPVYGRSTAGASSLMGWTSLPCRSTSAPGIGRVFQDPMMGTAPNMQIEENMALAMRRGESAGCAGP